jgi:hypothetical protein
MLDLAENVCQREKHSCLFFFNDEKIKSRCQRFFTEQNNLERLSLGVFFKASRLEPTLVKHFIVPNIWVVSWHSALLFN